MSTAGYKELILATLRGETPELREIPPERLDWTGPAAFLDLFHSTSGEDRTRFIKAVGKLIRCHPDSPGLIAELVGMASTLDLAEVEPDVCALAKDSYAKAEPVRQAVANFLAYRKLAETPLAARANPFPHIAVRVREARSGKRPNGTAATQQRPRARKATSRKRQPGGGKN